MKQLKEDGPNMKRRSLVIALGGMGVFSTLASRLFYLQVTRAEDYRVLSDRNRFNFNTLIPERGRILDRSGNPIATNKQDFRLVIVAERVKDIDKTLAQVSSVLPLSAVKLKRIKQDIRDNPKFVPVLVDEHLDWKTFSALNLALPDLPGVVPIEGTGRTYPFTGIYSHILGYVGKPSERMMAEDKDPLLRQPIFRVGKTGIEYSQDKILRGTAGRQKIEVNATGRVVREWQSDKIEAKPGQDVWLTLDTELQQFAADQFGEESGGTAVIDVMTGELRALLSMPTFDNNLFVSGLTGADMKRLNSDPRRPQFNKVIGGGYPPASTFKMAVMLAALEHRIISPQQKIFCTGKINVGNRDFHCWNRRGHGLLDMHGALQHSCDVYFYEIAQLLGMEKIKAVANKLGLGMRYELGLGGLSKGLVPDPEWKLKKLGNKWRTGDSLNAAIGQGFVLATPLQLAVMAARIANGTQAIIPSLIVSKKLPVHQKLNIDPANIAFVQDAMLSVTERPGGTAYRPHSLGLNGVQMAGKTGTGQVRGISAAERRSGVLKNRHLPWKLRDHSVFVGYAPYDKPRFAVSVLVEHGGSGAGIAAKLCRKILRETLIRDGMKEKFDPVKEQN